MDETSMNAGDTPKREPVVVASASSFFIEKKLPPPEAGKVALMATAVLVFLLIAGLVVYVIFFAKLPEGASGGGIGSRPRGDVVLSTIVIFAAIVPTLLVLSLVTHWIQVTYHKGWMLLVLLLVAAFLALVGALLVELYIYAVASFELTEFWQKHYRLLSF